VTLRRNGRQEAQPDAVLLEDDGDRVDRARLGDREREFAAREEGGFLPLEGQQVRLGEAAEVAALAQRSDHRVYLHAALEEEEANEAVGERLRDPVTLGRRLGVEEGGRLARP
jgi:hypothetical protein